MVGGHDRGIQRGTGGASVGGPPCIRTQTFGAVDQVIAAAEALAVAGQEQDSHRRIEVGLLDPALELGDQPAGQPVATRGAVEGQSGDRAGDLVLDDRLESGRAVRDR